MRSLEQSAGNPAFSTPAPADWHWMMHNSFAWYYMSAYNYWYPWFTPTHTPIVCSDLRVYPDSGYGINTAIASAVSPNARMRVENRPLPLSKPARWRLRNRKLSLARKASCTRGELNPAAELDRSNLDAESTNPTRWRLGNRKLFPTRDDKDDLDAESTNVSESDVDHEDGMNSDCDEITSGECWDSVIEWANCPTPDFVGEWENASIYGEALIWNEGERVPVEALSTSEFRMTYLGQVFTAKLDECGKLRWSDGDVWARKRTLNLPPWLRSRSGKRPAGSSFINVVKKTSEAKTADTAIPRSTDWTARQYDAARPTQIKSHMCASSATLDFTGEWAAASIRSDVLVWNEGEQVSIEVLNKSGFQMTYDGQLFIAKLSDRNTLCWSDGDVWLRESSSCTAPHAVPSGVRPSGDPINDEVYTGRIDSWRGNRGFVSCAVLEAQYDRQVFLHANDCDCKRPRKGDEVKFNLTLDNNGNPKACNAILRKPQSAAILRKPQSTAVVEDVPKQNQQVDARDYFAERAKQRAQRAKQRAESGR